VVKEGGEEMGFIRDCQNRERGRRGDRREAEEATEEGPEMGAKRGGRGGRSRLSHGQGLGM